MNVFLDGAGRNRFMHPQNHPPLSQGISSRILFQCQQHQHCHAEVAATLAAHSIDLAAIQIWPLSSLMSIDRLEMNNVEAPLVKLMAELLNEHPSIKFAECDYAFPRGDRQSSASAPRANRFSLAELRQSKVSRKTASPTLPSLIIEAEGARSSLPGLEQAPQRSILEDNPASHAAPALRGLKQAAASKPAAATADVAEAASDPAAANAASAVAAGSAVNDPIWPAEWDRRVVGLTSRSASQDASSLPGAWQTQTDASQVIVCITDSGIDYTHPDLAANMWTNPREIPGNGLDDDGNGIVDDVHGYNAVDNTGDIMDTDSHGTHTAGIVGAVANNGIGITGIAQKVRGITPACLWHHVA